MTLLTVTLGMTGCLFFAPGHNMDTDHIARDGSPESSRVELIEITPKVVAVEEATQTPVDIPADLLAYQPAPYRIGATDALFITVWDHPELTAPSGSQQQTDANGRIVRPDGTLFYPYVGSIKAEGMTIEELRAEIAMRLAKYIDKPQVDVGVLRFASQKVVLSGAFNSTAPLPITTTPLTLVQALGQAGINTAQADLSAVQVTREGHDYTLNLDALMRQPSAINAIYLRDGDRIHVPYNDRKKVYVMGEVLRPQALVFKTDYLNLSDAIGSSGGLDQVTSNGKAVYVIRGVDNLEKEPAKIYQLNADSPSAFILASRFQLHPQDVVYVGPAGITRWNRLITQLLPSGAMLHEGTGTAVDLKTLGY